MLSRYGTVTVDMWAALATVVAMRGLHHSDWWLAPDGSFAFIPRAGQLSGPTARRRRRKAQRASVWPRALPMRPTAASRAGQVHLLSVCKVIKNKGINVKVRPVLQKLPQSSSL